MERSPELVVGLLAILKSGAAYVPIDPGVPSTRLDYLLGDSAPVAVLTHAAIRARWAVENMQPDLQVPLVCVDADAARIASQPDSNPNASRLALAMSHLAYVIYTSGSTGLPKGAMIEHGQLANYLHWALETYAGNRALDSVVSSPIAFDATITSLYLPLLSGGCAHLLREGDELEGLERFLLDTSRRALVKITPAHLAAVGQRMRTLDLRPAPKLFVVGGEALPASTVALWHQLSPQSRVINEYGPTETVVGCVVEEAQNSADHAGAHEAGGSVPIGRPIANMGIRILDANRQPVPVGVTGELYIAGAQVGRGYHNRPELTAERFVEDVFADEPGARMYRTGDLVRWRPDGRIDYLGRNDFQVKVRGFRIELGEIEAKLATCAGVREAVVLAREDIPGEKRLVAYCLADDSTLDVAALRARLVAELPEYMVPSAFVPIASWPLTVNGKVDRKALPAPDEAGFGQTRYEAPQGQTEQAVAAIWTDLLQLERVGRHDSFFDVGGHSIMVLLLLDRLASHGVQLKVQDIYSLNTVQAIAAAVDASAPPVAGLDGEAGASLDAWLGQRGWKHRMERVQGRRSLWLAPGAEAAIAGLKKHIATIDPAQRPDRIFVVDDPAVATAGIDQAGEANASLVSAFEAALARCERAIRDAGTVETYRFSQVQQVGAQRRDRSAQHIVPVGGWWSADELRAAFAAVMRSQDMLRAAPDLASQRWNVLDPSAIRDQDIPWVDLRHLSKDDADAAWDAVMHALQRARGASRLCHVSALVSRSDTDHVLVMNDDHLISDGRSFEAIADAMRQALLHEGELSRGRYRDFVDACARPRDSALLEQLATELDNAGMADTLRVTSATLAGTAALPAQMLVLRMPLEPSATAAGQAFELFRRLTAHVTGLERFGMVMTHHGRQLAQQGFFGQVGLFLDKIPVCVGPGTTLEASVERAGLLHRRGVRFIDWHRSGDPRAAGLLPSAQDEIGFNLQQVAGAGFDDSHLDFNALHAKLDGIHGVVFDAYAGTERLDALFAFRGSDEVVEEVKGMITSAGGLARSVAPAGGDASAPRAAGAAGSTTAAGQGTDLAIVVEDLRKRYVDVDVVKGVSFSVPKGSCFGILGPNGAGKTSLLGMIEGIVPITAGRITMLGLDVATQIRQIQPRLGVQLQHSNYFQFLTVEELLAFYAQLRAAAGGKARLDPPGHLLERLELTDKLKFKVEELSGGQKQRLSIALALLGDPEILFLDEPSAALDPHSRRHLWEFIEELKQDRNRTIVLTTHYMEEAERLCDEILIMNRGEIVGRGDPTSLIADLSATQQVLVKLEIDAPGEDVAQELRPRFDATWDGFSDSLRVATDEVAAAIRQILSITEGRGIAVLGIQVDRLSLEDVFLNKTGKELKS